MGESLKRTTTRRLTLRVRPRLRKEIVSRTKIEENKQMGSESKHSGNYGDHEREVRDDQKDPEVKGRGKEKSHK